MGKLRIGIDLDNTLINYSKSYPAIIKELNSKTQLKKRSEIKQYLKSLDDSNIEFEWRKFQSYLYTKGLEYAYPSFSIKLLLRILFKSNEIFIVSHKTEFTSVEFGKQNLRLISMQWLKHHRLVPEYLALDNIYYCKSQEEKISKINSLNLDVLIDDLDTIIYSSNLDSKIKKILFRIEDSYFNTFVNSFRLLNILCVILKKNFSNAMGFHKIYGGNSVILTFSIFNLNLILKKYQRKRDGRVRLKQEFDSLRALNKLGVSNIPKAYFKSSIFKIGTYSFINGSHPKMDDSFIYSLITMLRDLSRLNKYLFYPATDSIDNCSDLLYQAKQILENLSMEVPNENKNTINERHQVLVKMIESGLYDFDLPDKTLILSDAGPHNTLRNQEGIDQYIDFEFFGYDTPYKFVADTLNHPKIKFSQSGSKLFITEMFKLYNLDYILFGRVLLASAVKWESIVLRRYFSPGNMRDFSLELDLLSKRIDFLRSFDPIRDVSNIEKLVSNYYID
jgi:hypothetical protein